MQTDKTRAQTGIAVGRREQRTVVEVPQTGVVVAAQLGHTGRIARTAGVDYTAAEVARTVEVVGVGRIAEAAHIVEAVEAAHTIAARSIAGAVVVNTRSGSAMSHVPLVHLTADRTASLPETACRASRTTCL